MKRDNDLIREIVFAIESMESGFNSEETRIVPGHSDKVLAYHFAIMLEGNLLVGKQLDSNRFIINRLTWAGHDFADAARSDTIWAKVTRTAKDRAVTVSLDVLTSLLKKAGEFTVEHGGGWLDAIAGWFGNH